MTTEEKQALRAEMRRRRKALPSAEKETMEQAMTRNFLRSAVYRTCGELFCFVSLPAEPNTYEILRQALADGKTVAVPRCLPQRRMAFHRLCPETALHEQLISGSFGVSEPRTDLPTVTPHSEKHPVCLVPGLAFDRTGGRLGYGAGYYDRFLAAYPFLQTIGCALSPFVIAQVPMEATDRRLNGIVTETTLEVWNG